MIKIALDAMGGDHAPQATVEGAALALQEREDIEITLTGRENDIRKHLGTESLPVEIVATDEMVEMHDSPAKVFKAKPNSSMNLAVKMQAQDKTQASVSAGNTGALLVSSMFIQGRLEGVQRAAIPVVIPSPKGPCVVLDGGANVDCKPQHLLQFAIMGSAYAQNVLEAPSPRVGLLSVGQEKTKGNELTLATYPLLEQSALNFVGNVEGQMILGGGVDVVVCDGFIGNIMLKIFESIVSLFSKGDKRGSAFDYAKYGGAPLLGVNGICIKAHGSSSPRAIKNAILAAAKMVQLGVNGKILEAIKGNG